jgi:hypothetical protein
MSRFIPFSSHTGFDESNPYNHPETHENMKPSAEGVYLPEGRPHLHLSLAPATSSTFFSNSSGSTGFAMK